MGAIGGPWSGHLALLHVTFVDRLTVGQMNSSSWLMQTWAVLPEYLSYPYQELNCALVCPQAVTLVEWRYWQKKWVMIEVPEPSVGKIHVCPVFWAAGQEWAGGSISEQTRWGGAMSAAKFDLPVESSGPSSQVFSSSSHHSDVARAKVPFCPPTTRSRGWVDPTGIIRK